MTTTTSPRNTNNAKNEAQKEGNKTMETNVNTQAAKNTSYTAFQNVVDQVMKDFKADNQELAMIVSMIPILDVLSQDNVAKLIKGDTMLYPIAKRKNAGKKNEPKPSATNQQHGALLELLPHYAELVKQNAQAIANAEVELEKEVKVRAKSNGKVLNKAQKLALFDKIEAASIKKNATKGEAELKIEAIRKMFERAIRKLYYLRRVSAENVVLNAKQKTITYTGFDHEVVVVDGNTKINLGSDKDEKVRTLAELSRDSTTFLNADMVTAKRSNGKAPATSTTKVDTTATAQLNPIDTTANNSKVLTGMVRNIIKDKGPKAKENLEAFKKAEAPKALFSSMLQALFINDGELNLDGLQRAIDNAMGKGKVPRKVFVHYGSDLKQAIRNQEDENKIA